MTTQLEWMEGDTAATRRLQLSGHDGTPPDLAGVTDLSCFVRASPTGTKTALTVTVDGAATDGIVRVDRGDLEAGTYVAQVQVTFLSGAIQTFPDAQGSGRTPYFSIVVHTELDPAA